jgi:epoxyqueuosine reductase
MNETSLSPWIAERASSLGFDLCGVVSAQKFPELAHTEEWLARGYAGEMNYLADPRRRDPASAMLDARSVIVCALNYNTGEPRSIHAFSRDAAAPSSETSPHDADAASSKARKGQESPRGWISRYAWGTDYHLALREKLNQLLAELQQHCREPFAARVYADTGPLQERIFAKYAGLGWLGKNTLLLNQQLGSFFFLGVILTTLEIAPTLAEAEAPPADLCGTCRRCLDACPTNALVEPYVMDARRCISYLTIELRGSIPHELREPMAQHVFGCDICQDVCPWNKRAPITQAEQFQPRSFPSRTFQETENTLAPDAISGAPHSLYLPELEWLAALTEKEFREIFRGSPIKRTKWRGLVRNACIALGNAKLEPSNPAHQRIVALLGRLKDSAEIVVAESAQWALSRIQFAESTET